MNYLDYIAIMIDEGLEESEAVMGYLYRAMHWQTAIQNLKLYEPTVEQRLAPIFMNYKIRFILEAIEIARFEKRIGAKIFEEGEQYIEKVTLERIAELAKKSEEKQ